nr:MAG TPA: hypothetical protein [Caudoviricetes sp.]
MNKLQNKKYQAKVPVFPRKSPNLYNINKLGENYNRKRDKTGTSYNVCCRFVIFALDNCRLNNERGNQILSHTRSCFIFCRRWYPRPCFAVIVDSVSNQGIFV